MCLPEFCLILKNINLKKRGVRGTSGYSQLASSVHSTSDWLEVHGVIVGNEAPICRIWGCFQMGSFKTEFSCQCPSTMTCFLVVNKSTPHILRKYHFSVWIVVKDQRKAGHSVLTPFLLWTYNVDSVISPTYCGLLSFLKILYFK